MIFLVLISYASTKLRYVNFSFHRYFYVSGRQSTLRNINLPDSWKWTTRPYSQNIMLDTDEMLINDDDTRSDDPLASCDKEEQVIGVTESL